MHLAPIALLTGLIPLLSTNVAYVIAMSLDHVPACFVYLDGCTTISSAGRNSPESLWFHGTMISGAVIMIVYWRLIGGWLKCLESDRYRGSQIIQWLGMVASIFLIIYTVALGFIEPQYYIQRRIGVMGFYGCVFLAQLLLVRRLWYISLAQPDKLPPRIVYSKIVLCLLLLSIGILSVPVSIIIGTSESENIIEWNFSVLMCCYFFLTHWAWRVTGFNSTLEIRTKSR